MRCKAGTIYARTLATYLIGSQNGGFSRTGIEPVTQGRRLFRMTTILQSFALPLSYRELILLGIEPRSYESESYVLTIVLQDHVGARQQLAV